MFDLKDLLSNFPLFSSLGRESLGDLASLSSLKEFKKGGIIYKENDAPNNLYIVISGRIKTYTEKSRKEDRTLEYLYKGTCFGIISLLTDQPHSVTAQAANDSLIIVIGKDKFNRFLNRNPLLAVEFSRMLSRRVKKRVDKDKNIFESLIISVYSLKSKLGKTIYSLMLAKALKQESAKKVIAIEIKKGKEEFLSTPLDKILDLKQFSESSFNSFLERRWGFDILKVYYKDDPQDISKSIPLLLSFLMQMYNFIILDLPSLSDAVIATSLIQSDEIHFLSFRQPTYLRKFEKEINSLKDRYRIKEDKFKIIVREPTLKPADEANLISFLKTPFDLGKIKQEKIFATLGNLADIDISRLIETYPNTSYAKTLRRIAREIAGVRIGLALGSGAAFGFAHVGVLKVLEEAKIDIDIVSGTSMGSIIACLWGLGKNSKQIKELIYKFKDFSVFSFLDIGLSKKSFLKGRAFKKILKTLFGNTTIHELKKPVLITSFDFTKRQPYVFAQEKSLIREAVLASSSIPGIFEPLRKKERLFFDGGILNPLPVGCLVKNGIKKIISVNITPSQEEIRKTYAKGGPKKEPNIFDFIFGSIEAMQRKFIEEAVSLSDIVIHPEFKDILWTDFKSIDFFIQAGEKAALKHIGAIKRLQEG